MEKKGWTKSKFLVDGFPRNKENQEGWVAAMDAHTDMKFVLFLDCDEQAMIDRITTRAAESGDNKRSDDNLEVLQKRFQTFKEQSVPIVDLYETIGKV